jgi:hypothetical protein
MLVVGALFDGVAFLIIVSERSSVMPYQIGCPSRSVSICGILFTPAAIE